LNGAKGPSRENRFASQPPLIAESPTEKIPRISSLAGRTRTFL
jgi:hypothetical protein